MSGKARFCSPSRKVQKLSSCYLIIIGKESGIFKALWVRTETSYKFVPVHLLCLTNTLTLSDLEYLGFILGIGAQGSSGGLCICYPIGEPVFPVRPGAEGEGDLAKLERK